MAGLLLKQFCWILGFGLGLVVGTHFVCVFSPLGLEFACWHAFYVVFVAVWVWGLVASLLFLRFC